MYGLIHIKQKLNDKHLVPPNKVELALIPSNIIEENKKLRIACVTNSGSNPPSEIQWTFLDRSGMNKSIPILDSRRKTLVRQYGEIVTISELEIIAKRSYNGLTVKCNVIYMNAIVEATQAKLNVICKLNLFNFTRLFISTSFFLKYFMKYILLCLWLLL